MGSWQYHQCMNVGECDMCCKNTLSGRKTRKMLNKYSPFISTRRSEKTNRHTSYGSDLFQDASWVHYTPWWGHTIVFNSKIKRSNKPAERQKEKRCGQNYMISVAVKLLHCSIGISRFPRSPWLKGTLIQWRHITRKLRTSWTWAEYVQNMN